MSPEDRLDSALRRYRITPWPVRILAPILAFVIISGASVNATALSVAIPVVLTATAFYMRAVERSGIYVTSSALESRMIRRQDSFRYQWADIQGFELVEGMAQVAVELSLRDGTSTILPSTRAWKYNRQSVERILRRLTADVAAANGVPPL